MKRTLLLHLSISLILAQPVIAQKVGIGTNDPKAKLHLVAADSALLILQNNQSLNVDVDNGLFFNIGGKFTGAIRSIGQGTLDARLGFFTYADVNYTNLKERFTILDNGNVGINTTTPSNTLDLNGTLRIRGGSPAAGKVLTSDANGVASWQSPNSSYFKVRGLKNLTSVEFTTNMSYAKVYFNYTTVYNSSYHYDFTTSVYNAPYKGIYHFEVSLATDIYEGGAHVGVRLIRQRNGANSVVSETIGSMTGMLSADIDLEVGDKIWVETRNDLLWVGTPNPNKFVVHDMNIDYFSGILVQPL